MKDFFLFYFLLFLFLEFRKIGKNIERRARERVRERERERREGVEGVERDFPNLEKVVVGLAPAM